MIKGVASNGYSDGYKRTAQPVVEMTNTPLTCTFLARSEGFEPPTF